MLQEHPVVYMFHAESAEELESVNLNRPSNPLLDFRFYSSFLYTRPQSAEDKAIQSVVALANATGMYWYHLLIDFIIGVRSHIVHLSSSSALNIVKSARESGVRISAETTYHYLYFCSEDIPDGNTLFKCCPPIRSKDNRFCW